MTEKSDSKTVLVVGASGFVGSAAVEAFSREDGCRVIALSRRRPDSLPEGVAFLSLDLLDQNACAQVAEQLAGVTHLVYAAVNETPGDLIASWTDPDHAGRNGQMLENLMQPLLLVTKALQQVILMHGTKAYGTHLPDQPVAVPLRESLPRPPHDDFYFRQQDYLWEQSRSASWSWTVFRAPTIVGGGLGSNLNGLLAIAVYAALCKQASEPLCFPGAGPSDGIMEMVDVELLANAVVWSTRASTVHNEIFNVANGDVYSWPDLWPVIADEIGLAVGAAKPASVVEVMNRQAARWAALVDQYNLQAPANWYEFLGESCALADFVLNNCGRSVLTSTIKIRQAGFSQCMDSSDCVIKWIRRWRDQGLLPPC